MVHCNAAGFINVILLLSALSACSDVQRTTSFSIKANGVDVTGALPAIQSMMQPNSCRKNYEMGMQVASERDTTGKSVSSSVGASRTCTY